jgi:cysteine desulfuration protein SufE
MDYSSCVEKQQYVKKIFQSCENEEMKYEKLIELGKSAPHLPPSLKTKENLVPGCQSTMFLSAEYKYGKVFFLTESDALISSGLAALLVLVYSGESPEAILKCPPSYLEELGISASLTPNRANGLYSIHLRMKQEALKFMLLKNG